jgi:acyl carrier protein
MEQEIREVLITNGGMDETTVKQIGVRDSLRDAGLTSLAVAQVMLGLEDKFEIEVPDEYLQAEHYENILSIMKIVESAR